MPPPAELGPLSLRPLLSTAVLLAVGILLHDQLPPRPGLTLLLAALAAAAAFLLLYRRVVGTALLALAIVLVGVGLAQREHFAFAPDDVARFATDEPVLATVEGTIADEPLLVTSPASAGRPLPPHQTFVLDVSRVLTTAGWAGATGQLPVRINQPNAAVTAGQTVRLLGMLQRPRPAANPGEFDWAVYYRRQRVLATLTVTRPANAHVIAAPDFSPRRWVRSVARHALAAGFTADHSADHAILEALFLGDHDDALRDAAADFQEAGVAYQLTVSGLHVAVLAGSVVWLCRRRCLRPRWSLSIGAAFTALYAAVATPSHSGVRAFLITAIVAGGLYRRRTTDRWQLIGIATLVMLVVHPLDIYTDGFQLSLAVIIAFLILLPAVRRWGHHELDKPTKPAPVTAVGRVRKWAVVTAQYALVAWLATLPLVAVHFGRITPWVVLVDVAIYPLVVAALFAGAGKVLLTLLWPVAAHTLAVVAGWPVVAMRAVTHIAALLPGASVTLPAAPAWAVVAFYAALLPWLVRAPAGRRRWALRLSPAAGLGVLLAASLGSSPAAAPATPAAVEPALRVTLLSLGAGQCAVIEPPGGGPATLVDAGSSTVPEVDRRIVTPFLQSHGDRRLADIFLSHGDFDHISAAGDLAAAFDAEAVFTSHHFRRNAVGNEPDLVLLARLDELHLTPREVAVGDHAELGGGAAVDVLWPPPDGAWNSNNAGLVLRLTYAGRRVLFPADIQDPAFAGLLQHPEQLPAEVLVAPHHGSSEPLTSAFLAAVHPSLIVSSNAARLSSKQRRFDQIVGEMPGGRVPLYRTSQWGAITVTVAADGRVTVSTYLHPK
jgi:competence protein ComEC